MIGAQLQRTLNCGSDAFEHVAQTKEFLVIALEKPGSLMLDCTMTGCPKPRRCKLNNSN